MANRLVSKITMNQVQDLVGRVSQSNHYLVSFSALNPQITEHLGGYLGIRDPIDFLSRKSGLLCSEAVLPTTSYATGEVKDNFMGIPQEFAHTRLYTDIDFSFYIDTDYTNLRIFEGWMDFISSGSIGEIGELTDNYYKRYRYPDEYKVQTMFISKFEKNISSQIDYQFINAFPKTMTTIPVAYGDAELLKVNVTFNYDRYVVNPKGSYTSSNLSTFTDVERTLFRSFDRIKSYATHSRKEIPAAKTTQKDTKLPSTQQLVDKYNEQYDNTVPDGAISISKENLKDTGKLNRADTAQYGTSWPAWNTEASDNTQSRLEAEARRKKAEELAKKEQIKKHVEEAKKNMPLPF